MQISFAITVYCIPGNDYKHSSRVFGYTGVMTVCSKPLDITYTGTYHDRCLKNMIRLSNYKGYNKIMQHQMTCSRLISNKGLYCQRTWFFRFTDIIMNYYIQNIKKHLKQFSTEDKKRLLVKLMYDNDTKNINLILGYIRSWEKSQLNDIIDRLTERFSAGVIKKPTIIKTKKIKYSYDLTFTELLKLISKIGLDNFNDKYGSLREYVSTIKKAILNDNEKKKKTNEKKKKNQKSKKVKKSKKVANLNTKYHLLPLKYILNTGIDEEYVKLQFMNELNDKRIKENPCIMTGSQVVQQSLKKLHESFKSYFEKKKSDRKCNPPRYLTGYHNIVYQNNSFKVIETFDDNLNPLKKIRLVLGSVLKSKLKNDDSDSDGFIYFDFPSNLKDIKIKEVEISPSNNPDVVWLIMKYSKEVINYKTNVQHKCDKKITAEINVKRNKLKIMSIDLGMVNLVTAFSPMLDQPLIYKGGQLYLLTRNIKN